MADSQTYARQLLVKRHGYPLWIPEPFGHSPIYRTKGVRIGDVGYVTQDGGFQTLFNIRAPKGHPINRRGVPEGFQQVPLDAQDIGHVHFHRPNSAVVSTFQEERAFSVGACAVELQTNVGAGAAMEYTWSSTEGAVLHLPDGASRINIHAKQTHFQQQAAKHAEAWYRFAVTEGFNISNGSLYLITGCDKTNSWMVGAFSSSSTTSGLQVKLRIGVAQGQASYNYSWTRHIPVTHRTGPLIDDTTAVCDLVDLERDDELFAVDAPRGNNQCAFIRGTKIKLKENIFRHLLKIPTTGISPLEHASEDDIRRNAFPDPASFPAWFGKGEGKGKAKALEAHQSSDHEREGHDRESGDDPPSSSDNVSLEEVPGPCENYHPSKPIADFMLEKYPHAKVAIVNDKDWMDLIDENDRLWPTNDELLLRFQSRHTPYCADGVVWPDDPRNKLDVDDTPASGIDKKRQESARNTIHKVVLKVLREGVLQAEHYLPSYPAALEEAAEILADEANEALAADGVDEALEGAHEILSAHMANIKFIVLFPTQGLLEAKINAFKVIKYIRNEHVTPVQASAVELWWLQSGEDSILPASVAASIADRAAARKQVDASLPEALVDVNNLIHSLFPACQTLVQALTRAIDYLAYAKATGEAPYDDHALDAWITQNGSTADISSSFF
ncbi:hypothetical protein CCMSSC00406_0009088 [Pleurotus cornucopiae]|uniref:Uncharacterized protein n=1 Tax=Pleurotus cornucopiae TaxID=5321 RepID=A0ACB7J7N7_PLECO|nr:hypothetical protein CCMSSC00406_0009088 [Pleurotus cornucopiae]